MPKPIAYGADWSARPIAGDTLAAFRYQDPDGEQHPLELVLRYADFVGQGLSYLGAQEYESHLRAGVRSYLIYQRTTRDPDGGAARGREFGLAAVAYAKKIGYRAGSPIFFTADAPIGSYNLATAMEFFAAAAEVVRAAGFLAGVYGFRDVVWLAQDRGIGDVYWLCGAESGWRPGIQLYQWNNGRIYPANVEADLVKQFEPIPNGDSDVALKDERVKIYKVEGGTDTREDMGADEALGRAVETGWRNFYAIQDLVKVVSDLAKVVALVATRVDVAEVSELVAAVKDDVAGVQNTVTAVTDTLPTKEDILGALAAGVSGAVVVRGQLTVGATEQGT